MSYKALYRTYRPQVFSDVTGQDVAVKTLQNAIKNNKISHAYLFSGPRGTGKTSIARIFAKALNCINLQDNEPCDECVSCKEISKGYNPDVIEIDAASNNGVDEIRDIRDKVKFLPSGSKYKVYIIDEVHMLTGGAFNALLKTLEEPPKHAVFILATTEPQKLPATIISRCQRFEFKALSVNEISERLKQICELENVEITDEALNCISESAEGAMRDALSILDQAISYGNKTITIDDINGVTGSLSFEKIIALTNAIEERSVHQAIAILNELISSGKEINKIINSLLVFYRDVLLYKSVGNSGFSKYIFSKEDFKTFSDNIHTSKIMYFVDVLCDVQSKVKFSTTPNIFLEISLIKMCNISIEELDIIKRVTDLEEKYNSLGNFDLPSENVVSVDNEKVNTIELRVNQIINELNRLEIRKQLEKIDQLANIVNNSSNAPIERNTKNIENDIDILKSKVEEMALFMDKDDDKSDSSLADRIVLLEDKINVLVNREVEQTTIPDLSDVYNKINLLENKQEENLFNEQYDELKSIVDAINDDINTIKENIIEKENKVFENTENEIDIKEIQEKVMFLEKRLYQIIAGELSTKKVVKKDKKNSGQIMLFGEELLSVNDFAQTKEKYDFEQLQKEKTLENKEETDEVVVITSEKVIVEEKDKLEVSENINEVIQEKQTKETTEEAIEETKEATEEAIEETKEATEEVIEETKEVTEEVIEETKETTEEVIEETKEVTEEVIEETKEVTEEVIEETKETTEEVIKLKEEKKLFESEYFIGKPKEEQVIPKENKYFNFNTSQEIIKKEKSVLVVSEKKVQEESSIAKDIIALESEGETKQTSHEVRDVRKDKFSSYNIKDIEQILHDSRAIESKNDKVRIEQVWKNMTRGVRPEYLSVIETLQEGKVAVVGSKEFIVVFPNVSLCNIVMRKKFKDMAIRILYNLLGDTYDYVALPIDVWTSKSREYKEQYQIGIKYPTLKPLNVPGLEIVSEKMEFISKNDKTINKTLELFGIDNVEIE